jgi:DNA-binding MarR family transcriptional regulator
VTARPLSDNDYRALAQFRHALRVFLRFSEEAARAEGLTPAQHQLLLAIRGHPDHPRPSITDLAEALQLRNNSVVGLVDRADAAGVTASHPDPADARRRLVSLTDAGHAVLERLSDRHRRELRSFRDEMARVLDELR